MKKLLIALFLLFSLASNAQDTIRLVHQNYTTIYNTKLNYPVLVEWWETAAKDNCKTPLPRKDQFAPDPFLKDKTSLQKSYDLANKTHKASGKKGFDRGHMCPAASNECSGPTVLTECFYFSNMTPQYHALNAGDWKTLETKTREWAIEADSVHVWAGSVGSAESFNGLCVPTKCWKVVYIKKTKEWYAYIFDNLDQKQTGLPAHKVTVADVEKLTGFKFH